jgi:hypothetical protein
VSGRELPGPDAAILGALAAAHAGGQDIGEFTCRALARLAAGLGSSAAVTANRPGSWEAGLVRQMLASTVGEDDEDLGRAAAFPAGRGRLDGSIPADDERVTRARVLLAERHQPITMTPGDVRHLLARFQRRVVELLQVIDGGPQ